MPPRHLSQSKDFAGIADAAFVFRWKRAAEGCGALQTLPVPVQFVQLFTTLYNRVQPSIALQNRVNSSAILSSTSLRQPLRSSLYLHPPSTALHKPRRSSVALCDSPHSLSILYSPLEPSKGSFETASVVLQAIEKGKRMLTHVPSGTVVYKSFRTTPATAPRPIKPPTPQIKPGTDCQSGHGAVSDPTRWMDQSGKPPLAHPTVSHRITGKSYEPPITCRRGLSARPIVLPPPPPPPTPAPSVHRSVCPERCLLKPVKNIIPHDTGQGPYPNLQFRGPVPPLCNGFLEFTATKISRGRVSPHGLLVRGLQLPGLNGKKEGAGQKVGLCGSVLFRGVKWNKLRHANVLRALLAQHSDSAS